MLNDFYDIKTEPVVQLSAFYGEPKKIAEKCLILFSKELHDYLLQKYTCREIGLITIMFHGISSQILIYRHHHTA